MFMVGGGILVHGLPPVHHFSEAAAAAAAAVPTVGGVLGVLTSTLIDAVVGIIAGGLVLLVVTGVTKLFKRKG
jgi:predicted DNA repair protein MutK